MPVNCSPYIIHGFLSGPGEAKLNLSKLTKQVPSDTPVLILALNQAGQLCARAMVPPLCTIENTAVSGLLTNSILFCWLRSIKDQCKKVDFDTNTQSRFAPVGFNCVQDPSNLAQHTWKFPCGSGVLEERTRQG